MKPTGASAARLMVTAFAIWFAHFVACWVVVEIWPGEWRANYFAWGFTLIALLTTAVHLVRLRRPAEPAEVPDFGRRFARGAIAIATVAVLFTALPSVVFLP